MRLKSIQIIQYILLLCLAVMFLCSGCATLYWGDDSWTGKDKAYHFVAGGIIGAGTTLALKRNGIDATAAPIIGISTSFAIGGGKEWYDANVKGSFWSWKDMAWDVIGGAAGSYLVMKTK